MAWMACSNLYILISSAVKLKIDLKFNDDDLLTSVTSPTMGMLKRRRQPCIRKELQIVDKDVSSLKLLKALGSILFHFCR